MQLVLQYPLFRRLVPEIRKAFQFETTRTMAHGPRWVGGLLVAWK
jgi:hypothetical protein